MGKKRRNGLGKRGLQCMTVFRDTGDFRQSISREEREKESALGLRKPKCPANLHKFLKGREGRHAKREKRKGKRKNRISRLTVERRPVFGKGREVGLPRALIN